MLDWLFGTGKEKKTQKKEEQHSKDYHLTQDQMWVYDYIRQYLTSPIWRNPILDFAELNCLSFQDTEQNKFQYTKIFQEFTGLATLLIQSMIQQTGITQQTLQKCIIKGIKHERDRKIFQQILLCDNFMAFKKLMVAKNKQLQVEALKKLHKQQPNQNKHQFQIDQKQLQRLEIQKAIAISLAMEEKAKAQQQKQLQQAIRASQISSKKQQQKYKKQQKQKQQQIRKSQLTGPLPPIAIGTNKKSKPIQQYKVQENLLKKQINQLKSQQKQQSKESVEERKKRLLQQRQLIRKRKQQQRKQQLNTFVQNKQTHNQPQNKISQEQLQRRRNLMKRLKQQLKQ